MAILKTSQANYYTFNAFNQYMRNKAGVRETNNGYSIIHDCANMPVFICCKTLGLFGRIFLNESDEWNAKKAYADRYHY